MSEQNPELSWPERPTCHLKDVQAMRWGPEHQVWQERDGVRACGYCGSLHPEDLLKGLEQGGTLSGCNWKGWPHKFYVHNVPGAIKWYNAHLADEGYSDAALLALVRALKQHSHIDFVVVKDGGKRNVCFSAPAPNYQTAHGMKPADYLAKIRAEAEERYREQEGASDGD